MNLLPALLATWLGTTSPLALPDSIQKENMARRKVCKLRVTNPSAAQQLLLHYQHQFMVDWRQVE